MYEHILLYLVTTSSMATMRTFEVIFESLNLESVVMKIIHRNVSPKYIIMNLESLLASSHRVKHLNDSRRHTF
jgi:hypothetical protein